MVHRRLLSIGNNKTFFKNLVGKNLDKWYILLI